MVQRKPYRYLKKRNYIVGVVSADDIDAVIHSLTMTGLYEYIDFLGAYDGINKTKPDNYYYHVFKEKFSLKDEEVLMVGDTLTDIRFAKNSQIEVAGVLSGACSRADFVWKGRLYFR